MTPHLPRALLAILAIPLSAALLSGCCSTHHFTESFDWPADLPCPAREDAAFYMPGYRGPSECGTHLVSIDGDAERVDEQCSYPVTTESCTCDLH